MPNPLRYMLLALLLFGSAHAQNLSAEEILTNLEESAESLQDASFLLTGSLHDADGTEIPLEVETQVVPEAEVARAFFIQPDALADNFIVVDGDAVYNYLFLTNQVTVLNINDPDALGGLFPEAEARALEAQEEFDFSLNLDKLFVGWEMSVEGYSDSPAGNVYELRFYNEEEGANIGYVDAQVVDGAWHPYRLNFVQQDGTVLAELVFNDFVRDSGLDPEELRYIPADAEVIDER